MLTLQVVSDIHLEKRVIPFEHILTPSAHVLALVGDIGSPFSLGLAEFIAWCAQRFQYVLYVPGNHEYYNTMGTPVDEINTMLAHICSQFPNVHFMYNTVFKLNQYNFIGTPLWSYVPDAHKAYIQAIMNDYNYIYKARHLKITVDDTNIEFQKNKAFLEGAIIASRNEGQIPIVLTHHTPSFNKTSAPCYENNISCHSFSTSLPCAPGTIRLWCCGHTHYNFRHTAEGYELLSNQFGYGWTSVANYNERLCVHL